MTLTPFVSSEVEKPTFTGFNPSFSTSLERNVVTALSPQRLTATPAGVVLCALADLPDPGARNFVLEIGGRRFHGFVVRRGETVTGFVDACPHMGLPLAHQLDNHLVVGGALGKCDSHGALFRPKDCLGDDVDLLWGERYSRSETAGGCEHVD